MKKHLLPFFLALLATLSLTACGEGSLDYTLPSLSQLTEFLEDAPDSTFAANGESYTVVNDNIPFFEETDLTTESYEYYSDLDALNRCGPAMACIGTDLMPTEDREAIGQVKPTGWQTIKYDTVDGKYLYNRCHLIGFQLTGENANECNLITGTRSLNVDGMLPFENLVADYVQETENHVLYRVTPVFEGDEMVARGVLMEALSVEDDGEGVCFNVYCYNTQPGILIDYSTGDSWAEDELPDYSSQYEPAYVININTGKFHEADCGSIQDVADSNKAVFDGDRQELIDQGYSPCGRCKP